MNFGLQENISLPLVFIDGITRCGKSAFSGIIPSLRNMENIQFSYEIESILSALSLKSIDPEYAKSFLRIYFNERSYNLHLSRNVNFRSGDQTGIDNYPNPQIYYDRLKVPESEQIVNKCRNSINSLPFQTHDFFVNLDHLNQMELNYKMILLLRHPIDNIYSWWTRGWGHRFNSDPRGFTILLKGEDELYPWYVDGIENKMKNLNPMEKCVVTATSLLERGVKQYRECSIKEKIHLLTFEDFCENPTIELEKICLFLNTKITAHTSEYLEKARFPRQLEPADRSKKLNDFKKGMCPKIYQLLVDYSERYEKNLYDLK
jgi:hypothetical protein